MKKILGFICAILITVFAIMPNAYAETQKTYGDLDMNRWMLIGSSDNSDILLDQKSVDYKIDYKDNLLCNFWVCYFYFNDGKYTLENTTINYEEKNLSVDAFAEYDKDGKLKNSYTYTYQEFRKIIPGSVGEFFYLEFFPKERINDIRNFVKEQKY